MKHSRYTLLVCFLSGSALHSMQQQSIVTSLKKSLINCLADCIVCCCCLSKQMEEIQKSDAPTRRLLSWQTKKR